MNCQTDKGAELTYLDAAKILISDFGCDFPFAAQKFLFSGQVLIGMKANYPENGHFRDMIDKAG